MFKTPTPPPRLIMLAGALSSLDALVEKWAPTQPWVDCDMQRTDFVAVVVVKALARADDNVPDLGRRRPMHGVVLDDDEITRQIIAVLIADYVLPGEIATHELRAGVVACLDAFNEDVC